jgi:excisionase family DNA binding protein
MPRREFLTQQQVADELCVDVSTVRRWIALGRLKAYRVGNTRTIRIERASVDALITPIGGGH